MSQHVAIVGATGAVGRTMARILEERSFPLDQIKLLASARSAGSKLTFRGEAHAVELLCEDAFHGVDLVLSSTPGSVSQQWSPVAAAAGAVVVDNSSAWRMDPDVPLVVPEVNPEAIRQRPKGIIANPNCSTIQMVVVLKPLHDTARIRRVVVSTYQAVSGKGQQGLDEMLAQAPRVLAHEPIEPPTAFAHPIAFNALPHIDVFLENGYTKEEMKMVDETRKILGDNDLLVSPTTVRVPVLNSHSESINIEFYEPLSAEQARQILSRAPGVVVEDDPATNLYPLATRADGRDEVFVGRIRDDVSCPNAINLWCVSDNLRKGAALNAVQIAEQIAVPPHLTPV